MKNCISFSGKIAVIQHDYAVRKAKCTKRLGMENDNNRTVGHFSELFPLIRKSIEASLAILITHGYCITSHPPVSASAIKHFTTSPIKKFQHFTPLQRGSISAASRLDPTSPIETVPRNKG